MRDILIMLIMFSALLRNLECFLHTLYLANVFFSLQNE